MDFSIKNKISVEEAWKNIVQPKDTGHKIHTPYGLTDQLLNNFGAATAAGTFGIWYWPEAVIRLIRGFGVHPSRITFFGDSDAKQALAKILGVCYYNAGLTSSVDMQFNNEFMNPPFSEVNGDSVNGTASAHILSRYEQLLPGGRLLAIGPSTIIGGGQRGLAKLLEKNADVKVYLNLQGRGPGKFDIQQNTVAFSMTKKSSTTSVIEIENNDKTFKLDMARFRYRTPKGDVPYVPRNINHDSMKTLEKIFSYSPDVFDFRGSVSNDRQHKAGFWGCRKVGIQPENLRITHTGSFNNDEIVHACAFDQAYPDENIESIFAGRIFHWVIWCINGDSSDRKPANLSYFPKFDLSRKWDFQAQAQALGLSHNEMRLIQDWSNTRSNAWRD